MRLVTPAVTDTKLAAALGRFSQACNYLEHQIEFTLTRMLPLTTDMGHVLFAGNQMRRNIEIIAAICLLPEVQIPDGAREQLSDLVPRLRSVNDDRSRLLHNKIIGGPNGEYALIVHKQDGKSSAAMPITTDMVLDRANEAEALCTELYIAPVNYDLSAWGPGFPEYPVKDYPKAQQPKPPHLKDRKRTARTKSGGGKTSPK